MTTSANTINETVDAGENTALPEHGADMWNAKGTPNSLLNLEGQLLGIAWNIYLRHFGSERFCLDQILTSTSDPTCWSSAEMWVAAAMGRGKSYVQVHHMRLMRLESSMNSGWPKLTIIEPPLLHLHATHACYRACLLVLQ